MIFTKFYSLDSLNDFLIIFGIQFAVTVAVTLANRIMAKNQPTPTPGTPPTPNMTPMMLNMGALMFAPKAIAALRSQLGFTREIIARVPPGFFPDNFIFKMLSRGVENAQPHFISTVGVAYATRLFAGYVISLVLPPPARAARPGFAEMMKQAQAQVQQAQAQAQGQAN